MSVLVQQREVEYGEYAMRASTVFTCQYAPEGFWFLLDKQ
jgi:hypothetical protein